jgi:hypothetical protein
MTDLYVFSKMENEIIGGEDSNESEGGEEFEEQLVVGGLSVSELLKRKSNNINDSKLYSFFDNLAVPIGLSCYNESNNESTKLSENGQKEYINDGVIKDDLFDRLFKLSSINLTRGKARKTRKKIPQ